MFAVTSLLICFVGATAAQPVSESNVINAKDNSVWRGTPMEAVVQQFHSECLEQSDSGACVKVKVFNLLDQILRKDSFNVADGLSIVPNDENRSKDETAARNSAGFLDQLEDYVKGHDLVMTASEGYLQGAQFKLSPRNLDNNELSMVVKLPSQKGSSNAITGRGRKSKLRKILVPILVFVLLKAMTLIPLAIGVLGLKAWNALQLSFISFLVSISLAIFQLCKKVASDSGSPIAAHIPFETSHYAAAARNFIVESQQQNAVADNRIDAQNLAYRNYAENNL